MEIDKCQIAENILARADSSLYFLEHALTIANMKANDYAWQRSILMILSYAFELIIKAEIVFNSENTNTEDIDKELKDLGHNIQKILQKIDRSGLMTSMGIHSYRVDTVGKLKKYVINFKDQNHVTVEDFVDIRYDYVKSDYRDIIDHDVIVNYVSKMISLSKNVKDRKRSA